MARRTKEEAQVEADPEAELDEVEIDEADAAPEAELVDIEDGLGADIIDSDTSDADEDEATVDGDEPAGEDAEALDELEAEELDMLTEDEASEVIAVDEQEELRMLRREQMAMESDAEGAGSDEFVCQSCFLVKRTSQLADTKNKICRDCAA